MAKRYRVTLTAEERDELDRMISHGKADARKLAHARVLLLADACEAGPGWADAAISEGGWARGGDRRGGGNRGAPQGGGAPAFCGGGFVARPAAKAEPACLCAQTGW